MALKRSRSQTTDISGQEGNASGAQSEEWRAPKRPSKESTLPGGVTPTYFSLLPSEAAAHVCCHLHLEDIAALRRATGSAGVPRIALRSALNRARQVQSVFNIDDGEKRVSERELDCEGWTCRVVEEIESTLKSAATRQRVFLQRFQYEDEEEAGDDDDDDYDCGYCCTCSGYEGFAESYYDDFSWDFYDYDEYIDYCYGTYM